MSSKVRYAFYFLFTFFILHTIRDVLQIYDIKGNLLADLFRTNHNWCRPYCDYVTLPPEIFGILGSIMVLEKNKLGLVGILVILSFLSIQLGFILQ